MRVAFILNLFDRRGRMEVSAWVLGSNFDRNSKIMRGTGVIYTASCGIRRRCREAMRSKREMNEQGDSEMRIEPRSMWLTVFVGLSIILGKEYKYNICHSCLDKEIVRWRASDKSKHRKDPSYERIKSAQRYSLHQTKVAKRRKATKDAKVGYESLILTDPETVFSF